jgi:urease accessory protein
VRADALARGAAAQVFAANRSRGRVALSVAYADGATRRAHVAEEGSLRVRFPNPAEEGLDAVLVNTAGGIAGGDAFAVEVTVDERARLTVTSAAAEKIYRTLGPDSSIRLRLQVASGGNLAWLPQETILFDRARLRRTIDIDVAETGSLLLAEALVFGRAAMGETVAQGGVFDRWRVRHGGRLVFADGLRLDGAIGATLRQKAVGDGAMALATVLAVPGDQAMLELVRGANKMFGGEVAASAWNGLMLVRLLARDSAALRHNLLAVLAALGTTPPRLWLN